MNTNLSSIAGGLNIVLVDNRVDIESSRPIHAFELLKGKSVQQALNTVPLLYGVCAMAQTTAAAMAILASSSSSKPSEFDFDCSRHCILVQTENLREHSIRLLRDIQPIVQKGSVDAGHFRILGAVLNKIKLNLFPLNDAFTNQHSAEPLAHNNSLKQTIDDFIKVVDTAIFAGEMQAFQHCATHAELEKWQRSYPSLASELLNTVSTLDALHHNEVRLSACSIDHFGQLHFTVCKEMLNGNGVSYAQQPVLNNKCLHTGSFARQSEHPLLRDNTQSAAIGHLKQQWLARLLDITELAQQLAKSSRLNAEQSTWRKWLQHKHCGDIGISAVETARGLLMHAARVLDGNIIEYCVVAPTEWNFHPEGIVPQTLSNTSVLPRAEREQYARWFINALDPCIHFQLEVA